MKPSKIGLQLILYAGGHSSIGQQLDVFVLVFFSNRNIDSIRQQLLHLSFTEILSVIGKVQLNAVLNGRVVEDPLQTLEEWIILLFDVEIADR